MELLRFLLKDGKEWFHWETDMDRLLAYIMKCGGEEIVMSTKYVNCTSGQYLNARSSANTSATISFYIPQGEQVNIVSTSGTWSKVTVVGYTSQGSAWVMTSYLSDTDPGRVHNTRVKAFGNKTLQIGRFGRYTKNLQKALGITEDGVFGSSTETAVVSFQSANGLTADGYAGTKTLTKLWEVAGSTIINNGY